MVSDAAEALVQLNLALMVYSDLRTCDAMSVLEDHFDVAHQDSVFHSVYTRHIAELQEIVSASKTTEDNPKLVTLYKLLSQKYSVNDARGTRVTVMIFTALHAMHTWSSDEKAVRLSVHPSVCLSVKRVYCDKTEERSVQIFIP